MTHVPSAAFRASPTIRHAVVDELTVILDLRTERYRVLDDAASLLWALLTGDRAASAALERYDLTEERLRADRAGFARRCLAEGLLEPAEAAEPAEPAERERAPVPSRPARTAGPRTFVALRALIATQRELARAGFRATYERYAQLPAAAAAPTGAVLASFVRAETFFVYRRAPDDCLARSLSLYRFLRAVGVPAEHVIGVHRFPFAAHAWVECGGAALLDDTAGSFTPLARIGGA